jgi:hypothetical protein
VEDHSKVPLRTERNYNIENESIIVKNEKIHIDTKGNEGFLASTSGTHVSASL